MKIQILCIGKLKEKYLIQGCNEYIKRIKPYAKCSVIELAEEVGKEPLSPKEKNLLLAKEANRIQQRLHPNTYTIALAIEGKQMSSEQLARHLYQRTIHGQSHFTFLIGSSYGLSAQVLSQAELVLSFSPMTFPHQLMRLILLEQIYRICKINRGETYHK